MAKQAVKGGRWVPLAEGEHHCIVALIINDECSAGYFLAGLDAKARARFQALMNMKAKTGVLRVPDNYRQLQDKGTPKVCEFKVHLGPGYRLYAVPVGKHIYVTHGGKKPKDRLVGAEIEKARRAFHDWQQQQ